MKKMVFITWTERRGFMPGYGKPLAALWAREGGRTEIEKAKAYVAKMPEGKVHVFSAYEAFAEAKKMALAAH
jgi:hypothetical protein